MKKIVLILTLGLTITVAMEPHGDKKRQPPQEAITICKGQNEGTICTITTPYGEQINGTCKNTPDKKYFACKPNNRPPRI